MTLNEEWEFVSNSEADTNRFGMRLADVLEAGAVVALIGELGAGKTRLVQACAAALDVDRSTVSSPTFVLIHEYEGRFPIYHVDAYRLDDIDEFTELGIEELMESGGVCLIEWADRVLDALPQDLLSVYIEATGPTTRHFRVEGTGLQSRKLVQALQNADAGNPCEL